MKSGSGVCIFREPRSRHTGPVQLPAWSRLCAWDQHQTASGASGTGYISPGMDLATRPSVVWRGARYLCTYHGP